MSRQNARDSLMALPAVFSLPMLQACLGGDASKAAIYATRWHTRGLLKRAGPRLGIYYNRVRDPQGSQASRPEAARLAFPSAVLTGSTVLHDAGWTTQIPQVMEVAVLARRSYPAVDGLSFHGRTRAWYGQVHDWIIRGGVVPALKPAMALADAWADPELWHPDPDDLEAQDVDWPAAREAFEVLGLAWPADYPEVGVPPAP